MYNRIENLNTSGTHGVISRIFFDNGTMIQKCINFNINILEALKITIESYFVEYYPSKIPNYIKSYRIEQKFYENNDFIKGVFLPKIYEIERSKLSKSFKIVMEDIPMYKKNRNLDTIKTILKSMILFYIEYENKKIHHEIWSNGGHWTGNKKSNEKLDLEKKFHLTCANFEIYGYNEVLDKIIENRKNTQKYYSKNKTLIHGDLKFENMFIDDQKVYLIDWQWVGYGNPITDIVYLIFTSLSSQYITIGNIKNLLIFYKNLNSNLIIEDIINDFKISFLDFLEYLICCKWSNLSVEQLEINDMNKKDGLHIRKLDQILSIFNIALKLDELIL